MELENNKEFDRQIKAKLDKHQAAVPTSLWKAIAEQLPPEEKVRDISGKRRFPYSWAAIAACLLIVFSLWERQPEEVIHLRSASSIVEKADNTDAGNPVGSAPATSSIPTMADAPRSAGTADITSGKAGPDRRSETSLDVYAASHRPGSEPRPTQREAHQQIKPAAISESDHSVLPEVQSVPEEEVAFLPAPIEGAIASDLPEPEVSSLSAEERSRPKVVSSVLNFIAGNIQIGGSGPRVEFSENEHGVLKVDFKGFFNKNNQGL